MDEFSIEILASAAGVAAIVVAIISLFRVLWPWGLSVSVLRILSVVLGVGLAALASLAFIGPVAPDDPAVAPLVLFWLFVGLNGATAGLAASAGFDTAKYGIDRTTVKNGVDPDTGELPVAAPIGEQGPETLIPPAGDSTAVHPSREY
jgi:hypothetical protein